MTPPDTTSHPDDALVDLATGAPVAPEVEEHLAACPRCAEELAALREVVGLVREPRPELTDPPASVWEAVAAEIDRERTDVAPDAAAPRLLAVPTAEALGDRSTDDAAADDAAADGGTAQATPLRPRRRVSPWWLVAAAAAGLVVGGVGVGILDRPSPAPAAVVLGETTLDTLDTQQALGEASAVRVDGHLDLDVATPGIDAGPGYLEVWLINKDLKRMVSLGVLRPGEGDQRFAIDEDLIDRGYVIVDISREGFDDKPQHSGDSVARGTLTL